MWRSCHSRSYDGGQAAFLPHRGPAWRAHAAQTASADTVAVYDSGAQQIAALDGTIVWVTGQLSGQSLMMRTARGTGAATNA